MKIKIVLTFILLIPIFGLILSCNSTNNKTNQPENSNVVSEKGTPDSVYLHMGKEFATGTQAVLGKNLTEAIQKKGAAYAVEFCNTRAYPLTDSMAKVYHAAIKRVTDKARNQDNRANPVQMEVMETMKQQMAEGKLPLPQLVHENGKVIGHYAITTNALCLQCHGKKDVNIQPETIRKIQALYPEDQATGYELNQLRGLWVVEMDEK